MKELVEHFEDAGEFDSTNTVHALKLHLTTVSHFEAKELKEKVTKHMNGLNQLIEQQKEQGVISGKTYNSLQADAHVLIKKMG